jgi:preprotein translocase subunit SecF
MIIAQYRRYFFVLTGLLAAVALAAVVSYGLKFGIEFTGGTYVKVGFDGSRPSIEQMTQELKAAGVTDFSVRAAGENQYDIRVAGTDDEEQKHIAEAVASESLRGTIVEASHIGPSIGAELRAKAFLAIGLVLACILLFVAFAFRKVSRPVSSWVYGAIALITLMFDVVVPVGFFAVLGHFFGAEVDTLFVTAVLTILGFSVHDTIVVFDRVRENLRLNQERNRKEPFVETAGHALGQTFVRSINTSFTVLITLAILFFVGPVSTEYFALTLLVGIIAGTYSSIFLATPLLIEVAERNQKA